MKGELAVTKHIPVIGITMGDAAGVGPEIITKVLSDSDIYSICRPIVYGDAKVIAQAVKLLNLSLTVNKVSDPADGKYTAGIIDVLQVGESVTLVPGRVQPELGKAVVQYISTATKHAAEQKINAIATAPVNKEAVHKSGIPFSGHTELLAELTNTKNFAMMLTGGKLRVIHVTTHVSMREACRLIKYERVFEVIEIAYNGLKALGFANPRIAVAGFNAHAGENGLFGQEEITEIIPAIAKAQEQGMNVSGPLPPDTVFLRASKGEFDIVVAMYHDQGHIPIKMLGFESGVNVTLGLPIIRTSVDHGTAYDIAWTGKADQRSMLEAIVLATTLARRTIEK